MWTENDKKQIERRGSSIEVVERQLGQIASGFPYLDLVSAAAVGQGILKPTEDEQEKYISAWRNYKSEKKKVVKFVPASGAASRMFKNLFAFLNADYNQPQTDYEQQFFANIRHFAFYDMLNACCVRLYGKPVDTLVSEGSYKFVVAALLNEEGMDYGRLPKALLLFHRYEELSRTPMEEHLVEAALYASANGEATVHFTVSHHHLPLFKKLVEACKAHYESSLGVSLHVSFSEQKSSTDTIAANTDGTPFRNEDGSLLFRPGGHGALIENLNELDADVVFIKNIDNVVPDHIKHDTVRWKEIIAGKLVLLQQQAHAYMKQLTEGVYNHAHLMEIIRFVQRELCCRKEDIKELEDAELVEYLKTKLDRPIRVCGVVRNEGEPGGGPFLVKHEDCSVDLQILESSQIDMSREEYRKMFAEGTHFNPVDLVCAIKNYKGEPYNLPDYVDAATGFISQKSKNGRDLLALELPGLWNGAMSNWSTVFVEVPLSTFNPVKSVNDLLRPQHQQA